MPNDYANPVALLEYDPAGVAIRAGLDVDLLEKLEHFASSLTYYVEMQKRMCNGSPNGVKIEEEEVSIPIASGVARMPPAPRVDPSEVEDAAANTKEARTPKRKSNEPTTPDESDPGASKKMRPLQFFDKLKVQHSVGLTRKVLNKPQVQRSLGLCSAFHNSSAVSKPPREDRISHLTFRHDKIDFPLDERKNFKWSLPAGKRFGLGPPAPLDPATHKQEALPIFLSEKPTGVVGPVPHLKIFYVGHYQCVRFERKKYDWFQGVKGMARLEFQFVHYDDALASAMARVAS